MGWKFLSKPNTVLARKDLVKEFYEMEPAPHDRPLSERRLLVYQRILSNKEFRTVTWASVLCTETNCTYRVNGKHTATMLSKLDPIPEFHVTVERYVCDRLIDVANLYNTFDSKLASRTVGDINASFAATITELKDISVRLINHTVSAASYIKWGESISSIPPAERAEELMDCYPFAIWLKKLIGVSATSVKSPDFHLFRTPVITAMMVTYNKSRGAAEEFWRMVQKETDPDRDHPSRVLARYLVRVSLSGGKRSKGQAGGREVVSWREVYVKCLHAWNAYRKGESTKLNYHHNADIPAVK